MQRRLLGRDMKMTRSETKRERKDIDGNPLIKRTAAQIARKAVPGDSESGALKGVSLRWRNGFSKANYLRDMNENRVIVGYTVALW